MLINIQFNRHRSALVNFCIHLSYVMLFKSIHSHPMNECKGAKMLANNVTNTNSSRVLVFAAVDEAPIINLSVVRSPKFFDNLQLDIAIFGCYSFSINSPYFSVSPFFLYLSIHVFLFFGSFFSTHPSHTHTHTTNVIIPPILYLNLSLTRQ